MSHPKPRARPSRDHAARWQNPTWLSLAYSNWLHQQSEAMKKPDSGLRAQYLCANYGTTKVVPLRFVPLRNQILCQPVLAHEAEVGVGAEVAEVGKDGSDLAVGKSEPTGERAGVLLDGGGGNEPACAEVVGLIDADDRILAVHILAVAPRRRQRSGGCPNRGRCRCCCEVRVRPKSEMVNEVTLLPRPMLTI